MVDLNWHEAYRIGLEFIDQEHKDILAIMQKIHSAAVANNYEECSRLSKEMINVAKKHFKHEEDYLEKVRFPGLEEHKKYHASLVAQATQVKKICEGIDEDHDLLECLNAMEEFLIDDILVGDLQFKSFLEYEGLIKTERRF